MSELVCARIRDYAGKLGLTHLIDTVDQLTARAEAEQLGYLEFLDQVLEEELGLRESRRFRNALKLSGLPHHKTLDEFDFAFQPELDPRKIRDLATLQFIDTKSNVALLGPTVIHGLILNRWCFRWWSWCCDRCGVVCGCCWLSGRAPSGEFAPEVEVLAVGSFEGGV